MPNTLEMAFGYFLYWRCGMALIKCLECGREVSEAAVACPGCGYPIAAGAVRPGEKTPELWRPTKPTNKDLGSGDPAPDWSDPLKIHRPDLLKIHKQDSRRNPGESIRATHPASADHWDDGGVNEGVWPEDVVLSLDGDLVVGWKPPCGHQFPMRIKYWIDNPGCPKCGKRFEDPKPGASVGTKQNHPVAGIILGLVSFAPLVGAVLFGLFLPCQDGIFGDSYCESVTPMLWLLAGGGATILGVLLVNYKLFPASVAKRNAEAQIAAEQVAEQRSLTVWWW